MGAGREEGKARPGKGKLARFAFPRADICGRKEMSLYGWRVSSIDPFSWEKIYFTLSLESRL